MDAFGATGLDTVLRRLGGELEQLRDLCARTEDAVATAGLPTCDVDRLQGLDGMTQHLGVLSAICRQLADQTPGAIRVDLGRACADSGLQDVNERLAGRAVVAAATDGAVDLF